MKHYKTVHSLDMDLDYSVQRWDPDGESVWCCLTVYEYCFDRLAWWAE